MKMHTRRKRKLGLTTGKSHTLRPKTAKRPKTFKTQEAAKKWAKERDMGTVELIPAKKGKKFQIA